MKIVFLDAATLGHDISLDIFGRFGEVEIHMTTDPRYTAERIRDADIVVTNKVVIGDRELEGSRVRLIVVAATGYNNIDIGAARKRGIIVSNVRGYSTESVVQHTFAMLFYLLHHLRYYDEYVKSGEYSRSPIFTHLDRPFYQLNNRIWGIIGLGTIGREVARRASVFVKEVIYYSTSGIERDEEYRRVSLEELLSIASVVSIHAPLNERTRDLIRYEHLKMMKREAIILNLGRGGIINERDLARALDEDLICCAGTDVLTEEPPSPDHPLLQVKNREKILITPHIAWTSVEARRKLVSEIERIIEGFLRGETINRVVAQT